MVKISIGCAGGLFVDGSNTGVHFTRSEQVLLRLILSTKGVVTKQYALTVLYPNPADEPENKILDVFLCKIRKKLGEHRLAIAVVWGRGWMRSPDYDWEEFDPDTVTVQVRQDLISDLVLFTGKSPELILEELISKAHRDLMGGRL